MENSKSRRKFIRSSAVIGGFFLARPAFSGIISLEKVNTTSFKSEIELFFEACESGNLEHVKEMLSINPGLLYAKNRQWQSSFTVSKINNQTMISDYLKSVGYKTDIHESALELDWDRYNELIGKDNNYPEHLVNKEHPMGGTAMWAAAAGGAGSSMWRIYGANGDPNLISNQNGASSPLQKALEFHELTRAEITAAAILSNNTDPNPSLNSALPPLHIAAMRGSVDLVEMLIRLGANVNQFDNQGKTAADLASYYGQEKTFQLLTNHNIINRTCRTSRYAYNASGETYKKPDMTGFSLNEQGSLVGSAHRNLDLVKKTIKKSMALAHSIATTSESAIEAGAHMGNREMVEVLLNAGAPYSLPTAVFMNDFETVKKYLDEDPNRIHERGAHDFALLWYSVISGGNIDMAKLLIDHGAKVEEQHFLGTTALHWSCFKGPIELVEFFVENGANVNRIGRKFELNGETPLQSTSDGKIKDYLKSKGAK